jgi:hypothetical protein
MKLTIISVLLSMAPLGLSAARAQSTPSPVGSQTGQEICRELVAFVQERGGSIKAAQSTITLDEVRSYLRDNNRFACRSAISIMRTSGVALPQRLLNAIGRDAEQPAIQSQQ